MYDELVTSIRKNTCHFDACGMCPKRDATCLDRLALQAADAIAELSRDLDSMNEANIALHGALPKWIPSEDYLPQNGEEIITLGPAGGMEIGFYRGLSGTRKDGWNWKKHTVRTVKFWLPRKALPEPPKEG